MNRAQLSSALLLAALAAVSGCYIKPGADGSTDLSTNPSSDLSTNPSSDLARGNAGSDLAVAATDLAVTTTDLNVHVPTPDLHVETPNPDMAVEVSSDDMEKASADAAEQVTPDSSTQTTPDSSTQTTPDSSTQTIPDSSTQTVPDASTQTHDDSSIQNLPDFSTRNLPDSATQTYVDLAPLYVDSATPAGCGTGPACTGLNATCCNGACVDLDSDNANCGACNNDCSLPNTVTSCGQGACQIENCIAPYLGCDSIYSNGCEANITTDPNNCGACRNQCAVYNGQPSCVNRMCGIASCDPGFADCDQDPSTGCEVDLTNDVRYCGGCNNPCSLPHVSQPLCIDSQCAGINQCEVFYADCNTLAFDGCEVHTADDPNNCGYCGNVCSSGNCSNSNCM